MNTSRSRKPVAKKITRGGQRDQLVGAGFDEDDGAGCADQPDQRALQRQHAGRGRHRWKMLWGGGEDIAFHRR